MVPPYFVGHNEDIGRCVVRATRDPVVRVFKPFVG
jgi:hypothetical protein